MPVTGHGHCSFPLALQLIPNLCHRLKTSASHQFDPNPVEIMSSSQPDPSLGNASLDRKTLRKQLDEDYRKAYDLVEADTLAFLSSIDSI